MERLEHVVPPVVWLALAAALTWVLDAVFDTGLDRSGSALGAAGLVVAVFGIAVAVAGVAEFRKAETTIDPHRIDHASTLVTSGIYRFTRNPMYVGLACMLIAWGLFLGDGLALAVALVAFVAAMTRFQIRPEERMLRARFGADHASWCARTRRWL